MTSIFAVDADDFAAAAGDLYLGDAIAVAFEFDARFVSVGGRGCGLLGGGNGGEAGGSGGGVPLAKGGNKWDEIGGHASRWRC